MILTKSGTPNNSFIDFLESNDHIVREVLGDLKPVHRLQRHQLISIHKSLKNNDISDVPNPYDSIIPWHSLKYHEKETKQPRTFKELTVRQPYMMFQYLTSKLRSTEPGDLFIGLLFVSGRRTCSLYHSNFYPGDNEYSYKYVERFKKKTLNATEKHYPLLCKFSEFKIAMDRFRNSCHALALTKTEKKNSRLLNLKYSKKHVKFLSEDKTLSTLKPHKLRVLYTAYVMKIFKFDRPTPTVIKYILDHSALNTSLHYNQWVIDWDEEDDVEPGKRDPIFTLKLTFPIS